MRDNHRKEFPPFDKRFPPGQVDAVAEGVEFFEGALFGDGIA
jgi:hypothetical protein